ncbi:MAG: hypothetical protein F6K42_09620 [Leptolyngbya sp. SIO1D8]|nr:hypothetical protein [Leptolyngbya sp. SIO1D8]
MSGKTDKNTFWRIAEAYLKQPLFDKKQAIQLNPFNFRRRYRLTLLEHCWQLDYEIETYRSQLEIYWQKTYVLYQFSVLSFKTFSS